MPSWRQTGAKITAALDETQLTNSGNCHMHEMGMFVLGIIVILLKSL